MGLFVFLKFIFLEKDRKETNYMTKWVKVSEVTCTSAKCLRNIHSKFWQMTKALNDE